MASSGRLFFDINYLSLFDLGHELEASEKQVKFALSYALKRTATALRTMTGRALRDELQLRTLSLLRGRLKSLRASHSKADGISLWIGINDMPASWFKGTPKQSTGGADVRGHHIAGGFIGKSRFKGRRTVFKRVGSERLPIAEQNIPVEDRAQVVIEDEIFVQTEQIFWRYFERDLRARVKYSIGVR